MHDRQFWQASYLFARDALLYWLAILTSAGRGYLAILALKCLCSRAPLDLDALVCIVLLIEFCYLRREQALHHMVLREHDSHVQPIHGHDCAGLQANVAPANDHTLHDAHYAQIMQHSG